MNYVEKFNLLGVEAKEIPCIKGSGAPATATEGAVGCFYMNTDNGDVYKCTAVTDGAYTWVDMQAAAGGANTQESGVEITYGAELVSADGWTTTGWTGDFANGFAHTVGSSDPLIFAMTATGTKLYRVEFDVESTYTAGSPNASTAFTVTLGNSERFITYKGGGSDHYSYSIHSVSDGDFCIIPCANADPFTDDTIFSGTVKNISIKEILSSATSTLATYDRSGVKTVEFYADTAENNNVFIGSNVGLNNIDGNENVGIGFDVLKNNGSGFWNTAIGAQALTNNTVGSRNVAIGRLALHYNTTGDRNYAIGTFALERNTCGRQNIAIGADALWTITNGIGNIALGSPCLSNLTSGNHNVCIGQSAGGFSEGEATVAIGKWAMSSATKGGQCVAIGKETLHKNQGDNNMAIGVVSLAKNTTGFNNVGVGGYTLTNVTTAYECTAIGHYAGGKLQTGTGSVFIGACAGMNTTGNGNVFIGYNAGKNVTTGYMNVLIGRNAAPSSNTAAYELNIANTIYGTINNGHVGIKQQTNIGGYLTIGAGDGTVPQIELKNGTLATTPVPGGIEYDGTDLYLTIDNGTRYKLVKEAV